MSWVAVHASQRFAHHGVACGREPSGLPGRQLVHIPTQGLNEERFTELRHEREAAGAFRLKLGDEMPKRAFDPRARYVAADIQFENGRKSREKQTFGVTLAPKVSADELSGLSSAPTALHSE